MSDDPKTPSPSPTPPPPSLSSWNEMTDEQRDERRARTASSTVELEARQLEERAERLEKIARGEEVPRARSLAEMYARPVPPELAQHNAALEAASLRRRAEAIRSRPAEEAAAREAAQRVIAAELKRRQEIADEQRRREERVALRMFRGR